MPEQSYTTRRRVEFRDTDMAGIVHFSVFFAYMEQAEHEMLRHLGTNVVSEIDGKKISWPRVSASCDYRRAIRYDDEIDIQITVQRIGNKSVTYGFRFTHGDDLVAEGRITAACCVWQHGEPPQPITIPDSFRELLNPYLVEVTT